MWNPFLEGLQKAVNRSGLSNGDIARLADMESSTVGRILSGKRIPNSRTFKRLTDVLPLGEGEYDLLDRYRRTAERLRDQSMRSTDELPIPKSEEKATIEA